MSLSPHVPPRPLTLHYGVSRRHRPLFLSRHTFLWPMYPASSLAAPPSHSTMASVPGFVPCPSPHSDNYGVLQRHRRLSPSPFPPLRPFSPALSLVSQHFHTTMALVPDPSHSPMALYPGNVPCPSAQSFQNGNCVRHHHMSLIPHTALRPSSPATSLVSQPSYHTMVLVIGIVHCP